MKIHEKYINRCIQLAKKGLGQTYPNPLVGSVIVYNNKIIGEGWHRRSGESHAEVNAIRSVGEKSLLKGSTLYVSLEPCSHFGKTPPCSDLIISSGIKKVVIGMSDPFPEVSGRGIKKLMDSGCDVIVGVLEKECAELNKRFLSVQLRKRPFIILKWAVSEDGFIAPSSPRTRRRPVWISNRYSKQRVHKWRSEEQSILVGTNTAIADNPELTVRLWHGNDPVRVVLDRKKRIPEDSAVFKAPGKTIVMTGPPVGPDNPSEIIFESIDWNGEIASEITRILYSHNIQSVIIEGGSTTLKTFIEAGLWDEARVFTGEVRLMEGIKAPGCSGRLVSEEKILSDTLKIYRND